MASPWDRLGQVASVMQVTGVDAMGLVSMIVQAAHIARQNRDQCQQLAQHVQIVGSLLGKLQIPELRRHPETRLPLDQLNDALLRALMLVRSCSQQQEKMSRVYQMITGGDVANKLRRAQEEIDRYIILIPMITTVAVICARGTHQESAQDDTANDATLAQRPSLSLQDITELLALEELPPTGTVAQQPIIDIVGNVVSQPGKQQQKKAQKRMMIEYFRSPDEAGDKNLEFLFMSFEDIAAATDNFSDSNIIGKGGFGRVYKGMLEGTKEVAVKRLGKCSGQGTEEFRNEVVLMAKLQHKNLVKLLGCGIHEDEKLLVYEYLPNKSLDYFLFDSAREPMLKWPTRSKIIQGVARGISYLHQDSRLTVIHRDLSASNILLDKEMSPKISDFGVARILCGDQLQGNTTRVVGTYGYMSPEYAMEGAYSVKSDTYSFGVLLLEIVSGLRISIQHLTKDFPNLKTYAWNLWKDGKVENMVEPSVQESCSFDEVSRYVHIGLLCVQDSPDCRPLMSAVVYMLENESTRLPTPKQPTILCS